MKKTTKEASKDIKEGQKEVKADIKENQKEIKRVVKKNADKAEVTKVIDDIKKDAEVAKTSGKRVIKKRIIKKA